MIVIVVLGVLAAIAYPSYREFSTRAKRNEARAALLQIATNQERFYLNNQTYTTDLTVLGFDSNPFITDTGSYRIRVMPGADVDQFTAEAVFLLGGNEAGICSRFTIDSTGAKASSTATDCWTRSR